jgi:alpha-1,3-rhamnosyl/mannosyltransferase
MEIGFDIRFAALPGGGRVYVKRLLTKLVEVYPQEDWRLYYHPWCEQQQDIIKELQTKSEGKTKGQMELVPVRSGVLSLGQHIEFRKVPIKGDVYHYPHFDLPLGAKGAALVVTIHDVYPLTDPGYCSRMKRAYFRRLSRRSGRRAARIIAVSEYTKSEIVKHLKTPEEKIIVVPQSQGPEYHPIEDQQYLEEIREKYYLPRWFIFYTGNHKRHKNLSRLLEAYARLPEWLREDFALVLTGRVGAEARELLTLAEKLQIEKQVQFTGWVEAEDLPGLYNLAGLVVLPSFYEGFGYASLEAMACGCPVAGAGAGAIPEVVGQAGRLFDPSNVEEMAEVLRAGLEEDVDNPEVRQKVLQQAAQFSAQKTAQLTYEAYKICNMP